MNDYPFQNFIDLTPQTVPAARATMGQFAEITITLKGWKGRVDFCRNFYAACTQSTYESIKDLEHKLFRGYEFVLEDVKINLSSVYVMIGSGGNLGNKQIAKVAGAFNRLYSSEIHYRISNNWTLEHINTVSSEQNLSPDSENVISEVQNERLSDLKYTGKWQGVHFYSRASFDHKKQVHLLRQICIEILESGKATLQYMDMVKNKIMLVPELGEVSLGTSGMQLFIYFSYHENGNPEYTARAIYCLTLQDHGHLQGSYVGFSPTSKLPYGGAISLRKLNNKDQPVIQNYDLDSGSQTLNLWDQAEIAGLKNAYENYLETPEKSLSKVLHALFREYSLNTELTGSFISIGIGSGGGDDKELDTLISYPMHFHDGLCTTNWKKGEESMISPVRSIGDTKKHIWLHLHNDKRLTNISYYISNIDEKEYRGTSFRLNANNKLQSRTEILIRKEKLLPDEQVLKRYRFGSHEYEKLKKTYYDTHSFFKELIESFEPRVHERADNGTHILQNRTKNWEKNISVKKLKQNSSVALNQSAKEMNIKNVKVQPAKKMKPPTPGTPTFPLKSKGEKKR